MSISVTSASVLSRLWFTFIILVMYRLGTYIPIPGINVDVVNSIVSNNSVGVLGIFNLFSGGALGRMTILSLNVMPYIVSSIAIQLLSVTVKSLADIKQEGDLGKKKINSYIRYMTIVFCLVQAFVILVGLENMNSGLDLVVVDPGILFRLVGMISMLGGTMFVLWLGERINFKGVGNGISLIIFTGIVAELPGSFSAMVMLIKNGSMPVFIFFLIVVALLALLFGIIFIERSFKKILVQYPKRQVKNKLYDSSFTYMPLKINVSGVIPPIFSNAILLFPATISNFDKTSEWSRIILTYLSSGKILYVVLYAALIVFFAFFYTSFVFSPEDTSDILKKNGGFLPGKRPGKNTCEYFKYIILRLTVLGSFYLAVVCIVPEILRYYYEVPFTLGGTSLLIVVSVIIDTFSQVQSYLFTSKYDLLLNRSKLWKAK